MAVSLLKTTNTNLIGNYTPNALLYGYFDLTSGGNAHINSPSLAIDGQLLVVVVRQGAGTSYTVTWDASYIEAVDSLCSGNIPNAYWIGLLFCNAGQQMVLFSKVFV